ACCTATARPARSPASRTRWARSLRRASDLEQRGVEAGLLVARALELQVEPAEHEKRALQVRGPPAATALVDQPARHAEPLGDLGGCEPLLHQLGHVERAAQVGSEEGDHQERRDALGMQLAQHPRGARQVAAGEPIDRKSTRLNSSHEWISYAVFCLKKKRHDTQA